MYLLGLAGVLFLSPALLAQDATGAKVVISKFLSSQKSIDGEGSAGEHVIADLDGDGKSDIVLVWDLMGPTHSSQKLTILLDQGKTYRALTADLTGHSQKLTVKGRMILVDTVTLGPKDPLCCPTAKKQLRFLWSDGKLTAQK